MSDKVHRVIVSFTDGSNKLSSIKESIIANQIKILDKTTMLLRLSNGIESLKSMQSPCFQQLQFDALGYEDEQHMREELSSLLHHMFSKRKHGCLLRLTPRRAHNNKLMTRLLVNEVDKMLLTISDRLDGINVEFYNVRKFDMVNMLAIRQRNRDKQGRRLMLTTREMFQWLHNEYSVLRGYVTGDEYINVEFMLTDGLQKQHKLHLALFHIFDCNKRTDLVNFFKTLSKRKRTKNSMLTDCIKESFDGKRPNFTLVLCELPLNRCGREMHKFLQLADTASMNIQALRDKINPPVVPPSVHPVEQTTVASTITPSVLPSLPVEYKSSSQSLTSSQSKSTQSQKRSVRSLECVALRCRPVDLSDGDYSKLASWYNRIDTKFAEVKINMEKHYNVQYRQKFLKIFKMLHSSHIVINDRSGGDAHSALLKSDTQDRATTAQYQDTLKQFKQLEREVNQSGFACLSTYMSTKNYELLHAEQTLQDREIANLQEHRKRL